MFESAVEKNIIWGGARRGVNMERIIMNEKEDEDTMTEYRSGVLVVCNKNAMLPFILEVRKNMKQG